MLYISTEKNGHTYSSRSGDVKQSLNDVSEHIVVRRWSCDAAAFRRLPFTNHQLLTETTHID